MTVEKLSEIININKNFKNAINLYLSLNKEEKINGYIPTKSSVEILKYYLDAVKNNNHQASILIGSYGKGKSHLLLILLAILSLDRNEKNNLIIERLVSKIKVVDVSVAEEVNVLWHNHKKLLPIIISGNYDDLNQTFMVALNNALKNNNLEDIMPDTYYSSALETIERWANEYPKTFKHYELLLKQEGKSVQEINEGLKICDNDAMDLFKDIYPVLTAGSTFNPLIGGDVIPMYKSIAFKLQEEYDYSGMFIVFDEFSKYIESQDKNNNGTSMKLLQDMSELAFESKNPQIFLTLVTHKSIKEYGKYLSESTINAYTGIEGRIEDVLFNTSSKNNYELVKNAIGSEEGALNNVPNANKYFGDEVLEKNYSIPAFRSNFLKEDFENIILKGCFPLSPCAAYALLNVSEKVAQNERTLFTFISKDEPYSLARYIAEHPSESCVEWTITPDRIYDYFNNVFKKDIANEFIHTEWLNADYAISKADNIFKKRMLKTIAIINIINKYEEIAPTREILEIAAGLPDASRILDELVEDKLLYLRQSNNCFAFKTRAGVELKKEISKRRIAKTEVNLPQIFTEIADSPFVLPKGYNNDYRMTRYFRYEYMSVYDFAKVKNIDFLFDDGKFQDGKILALYSVDNKDFSKEIFDRIAEFNAKNIVVIYSKKPFGLDKLAKDYAILQDIKKDEKFFSENEVLLKELSIMEEDVCKELHSYVDSEFGNDNKNNAIYYDGKQWLETGNTSVSKVVDTVCKGIFNKTVVINNELINKQFVTSSPIKKARKLIINSILDNEPNGIFLRGTSAEATIYRAVMINSGIFNNDGTENVKGLLNIVDQFFAGCIDCKKSVNDLVDAYSKPPYGMRLGVLPIILAYKLHSVREDIVIYYRDKEVDITSDSLLNMVEFPEDYYVFISQESVDKEEYVEQLIKLFNVENEENLSGNRISNILECMQRWYRALPQATKNLQKNSEYLENSDIEDIIPKLKKIMQKPDANAYENLFTSIPAMCDTGSDYVETVNVLTKAKQMLDSYMKWLLDEAVTETKKIFGGKENDDLYHTLENWYSKQSEYAKNGLHDSTISGLMSYIHELDTFDKHDIVKKLIKIVTEVYIDVWNDNSFDNYLEDLEQIKNAVEGMGEKQTGNMYELNFIGKNGEALHKYYEPVDESTGAFLRNILEDSLEDFSDLDVNAKVSILLEMIEKVMKKED